MFPGFVPKGELFAQPSVSHVRALHRHEDPQGKARVPRGVARLIENLAYDEYYLVETPLIASEARGRGFRTLIRQADYIPLLRAQEEVDEELSTLSPHELLERRFPVSHAPWEMPPFGYSWRVPGTDGHFVMKPLLEEVEGALLFWYDTQAPDQESLEERLKDEVQLLPQEEKRDRAKVLGANVTVKVPSRTQKKRSYVGTVYHVPVVKDAASLSETWRSVDFETTSRHGEILRAGLPSEEQLVSRGYRRFVVAQQNAQMHKLGLYFKLIKGNRVPMEYLPVMRVSQKLLDFHSKLVCNALVVDAERRDEKGRPVVRHLNDAEKNRTLMEYVKNNGFYGGIQPRTDMTLYKLGVQGRHAD